MRRFLTACMVALLLAALPCSAAKEPPTKWKGVDENVVEKFAEKAGHPARKPLINTDQGDLLLFVFLVGGTVGGFIAGYYFRELFPARTKKSE